MRNRGLLAGGLMLFASGCVSAGKYDAVAADAAHAHDALRAANAASARLGADARRLEQAVKDCETQAAQARNAERADTIAAQTELDEATAVNQQLHDELVRLGKDSDQLLAAKGALASSLEQARARLDELRKAQAAAEARSALFRELALKFKRMIDAGDLQITLRSGRMVLVLPNDVLFDSGKASINAHGKEALSQVAAALVTIPRRRFQVAGHSDNQPIRLSGFASNWQLSTERALAVVNLLVQEGMRGDTLSAAGYGEFDPVAQNDSAENKGKNRRIEITLQPNIDELVAVPQGK